MSKYITIFACLMLSACQYLPFTQLKSTTTIGANNAFLLGDNPHGSFAAHVKNLSLTEIQVWRCPIEGGKHSPIMIKPQAQIFIRVEKNTALRIENPSSEAIHVLLKVKGDTGLSMDYQKP